MRGDRRLRPLSSARTARGARALPPPAALTLGDTSDRSLSGFPRSHATHSDADADANAMFVLEPRSAASASQRILSIPHLVFRWLAVVAVGIFCRGRDGRATGLVQVHRGFSHLPAAKIFPLESAER